VRYAAAVLVCLLPGVLCLAFAGWGMARSAAGWGWFLGLSVPALLAGAVLAYCVACAIAAGGVAGDIADASREVDGNG
jgi:hypothetical protein